MSRPLVIIVAITVVAAATAAATVLFVKTDSARPIMSEEQKAVREKFFGTSKELPPIKEGQEMRPRW
ncbi:entry exclusion protein TrbK [Shinella sp. CPCC 101442]|uniref:entry exclusion protein TrbK n=1 Tax=Shinella sp. CPCC 101442 TaxID=2932265 RepID=UPI0021535A56|nr:entry exclusion protein TrbK [Shinella sp. CPCC 101442]MCR6502098.1 entry exclusion protein TrbK [Shinella sp. CPCC 101442]